ncbi:putative thiamine transporter SLC35F3 isoform X1 [Eriocheir sinensis]|uniref:putative thiamine transporter SLC35F3 isoform X1 n=1 Tax=Eriocheir sinensis TaxID=95602 RepID=UPI0021C91845|nr:putative thiamine transporter SLC35F3 isoform X1 [Eriocheir sinensis]
MSEDAGARRPSIATIFNPRRGRGSTPSRPSVVVTDEDSPGPPLQLSNGSGMRVGSAGISGRCGTPGGSLSINQGSPVPHPDGDSGSATESPRDGQPSKCARLKQAFLSQTTKKIVVGWLVTCCVTTAWVGATHLIKDMFLRQAYLPAAPPSPPMDTTVSSNATGAQPKQREVFDAPFFTTWFCTAWTGLFFPLYLACHSCFRRDKDSLKVSLKSIAQNFRDRGVTFSKFMTRCCLFCLLWVVTNYMYVYSLRILDCTDVMALYSAHVSFVYLLSWVILHDQFVGVRIVAVILCNTGIALLAYMDGITRTKTLGGVVLAAASAAGSAVYKVLFKKVIGEASFGQVSLIFTVIALLNTILLSPIVAAFYFSGYEVVVWSHLPWPNLLIAAALSLAANLLGNFGVAFTFEIFITLGLVLAIPVSAALDIKWYHVKFEGMKLAGVVLIVCGFFLVLFPANWPEYITKVLRWGRHRKRNQPRQQPEPIDYRTGLISRSHLRSPSGLIR